MNRPEYRFAEQNTVSDQFIREALSALLDEMTSRTALAKRGEQPEQLPAPHFPTNQTPAVSITEEAAGCPK